MELLQKRVDLISADYKIFSVPLTQTLDTNMSFHDCIVGFCAKEDSSFQMKIGNYLLPEIVLKKGEIQLAWFNKEIIPNIRICYNFIKVVNYKGSIEQIVVAFESAKVRRELCQREVFELGEGWEIRGGKICRAGEDIISFNYITS